MKYPMTAARDSTPVVRAARVLRRALGVTIAAGGAAVLFAGTVHLAASVV